MASFRSGRPRAAATCARAVRAGSISSRETATWVVAAGIGGTAGVEFRTGAVSAAPEAPPASVAPSAPEAPPAPRAPAAPAAPEAPPAPAAAPFDPVPLAMPPAPAPVTAPAAPGGVAVLVTIAPAGPAPLRVPTPPAPAAGSTVTPDGVLALVNGLKFASFIF